MMPASQVRSSSPEDSTVGVVVATAARSELPRDRLHAVINVLDAGQPVMIQCDMGFLPYFDFGGEEYHFGGHVVVVCGYDPDGDQVLVADRDEDLHPDLF